MPVATPSRPAKPVTGKSRKAAAPAAATPKPTCAKDSASSRANSHLRRPVKKRGMSGRAGNAGITVTQARGQLRIGQFAQGGDMQAGCLCRFLQAQR